MRILFAALALPYPPMNGHRLRTWATVRTLAEQGHDVSVVSFAEPDEMRADLGPLKAVCRHVDLVAAPARRPLVQEALGRLRAVTSPKPYPVHRLRSQAFTAAIERRVANDRPGLVICDGIYNVQNLPARLDVPVLLNKDDVAYVIVDRYLALERHPIRRLYGRLEAGKIRRWEKSVCCRMAGILACSDHDAALLKRLAPDVPVSVIANVVDTTHYAPRGTADAMTVLFQGGMDWHPNRDGVEFFAFDILPDLRRQVPEVLFRIAGRSPSDEFRRRFDGVAALEFTGTVPEMRDEIAKATVCVVPLRIGSGTRLKILEAAAMGKAIVSTTLGAEGLNFVPGREILIADTPAEFVTLVQRLLADPAARRRLGDAARARVETDYSLAVLGHQLPSALRHMRQTVPAQAPAKVLISTESESR
jgi:glycosyltransferase involved in cell wall biosynthesis